jgi:hypothetical protein
MIADDWVLLTVAQRRTEPMLKLRRLRLEGRVAETVFEECKRYTISKFGLAVR